MFRALLITAVSINGQYPYVAISLNRNKVSVNHFNKLKYLDPRLGTAKARSAYGHILTLGLKVLRLGGTDFISIRPDFRLSVF
jgi:hypothetical protein